MERFEETHSHSFHPSRLTRTLTNHALRYYYTSAFSALIPPPFIPPPPPLIKAIAHGPLAEKGQHLRNINTMLDFASQVQNDGNRGDCPWISALIEGLHIVEELGA